MEKPEFRVYVSSRGNEPVATDIVGEERLRDILSVVRNAHPIDIIYVREVHETVVRVIRPGEHIDNGFHFTS